MYIWIEIDHCLFQLHHHVWSTLLLMIKHFHSYDKHMIILYHPLMQLLDDFHYLYRTSSHIHSLLHHVGHMLCVCCDKMWCIQAFPSFRWTCDHIISYAYATTRWLPLSVSSPYTMWVSPTATILVTKKSPNYDAKLMFHHPGESEWAAHSADFTM